MNMNMVDLIYKKKEGLELTQEEIFWFVQGYTQGDIPDYQVAAFLMAVCFQKMSKQETFYLTEAMRNSGDTVDLSSIPGIKVDKHSTGGVGDKTTLIVAPIAAACGVPVAKMSGRGLGFTGGTVDKLESVPGFQTSLAPELFFRQVQESGIAVIGQTAHIAAADKKLYALRDVTATVENISLIASSIMSKKLAAGSDAIVLDVKCGEGAFMKTLEDAEALGNMMVEIGKQAGKKTIAVITDMNQPLGFYVGNSLEVIEAIETLKGHGPKDIENLCLTLASYMLYAGQKAKSPEEGLDLAKEALRSGAALQKLGELFTQQGGTAEVLEDYSLFPQADVQAEALAEKDGYVCAIDAMRIGLASQHTGAGRERKEDPIDLAAGIVLKKKVGDPVKAGEVLAVAYGNDAARVKNGADEAKKAFAVGKAQTGAQSLIKKILM